MSHTISKVIKFSAGAVNCAAIIMFGFFTLATLLSPFKWTPFGYEPDGLQMVGLLLDSFFLFISGLVNIRIFQGCQITRHVIMCPFYIGAATLLAFIAICWITFPLNSLLPLYLIVGVVLTVGYACCAIMTLMSAVKSYKANAFCKLNLIDAVLFIIEAIILLYFGLFALYFGD